MTTAQPVMEIKHLTKHYATGSPWSLRKSRTVHAVDDVSFQLGTGETLGIVGESGCGKTTVSRVILGLVPPTDGQILFQGSDISRLSRRQRHDYRTEVQAVFQDPYGSLNPRMRVSDIILEPRTVQRRLGRREAKQLSGELLESVGLPGSMGTRFPHEFSGGQRQRLAIARALSVNPSVMVLDEPVSALDVSIRAQVINLLMDLQQERGLSYLLIAHDLAVVAHSSHRIGVMYLGKLVELGPSRDVVTHPLHPYTQLLLSAHPVPNPNVRPTPKQTNSELPSPINPPSGCRFRTRCPLAADVCAEREPEFRELEPTHWVACHMR
ncbi:MAG: ATP-binding cassette domain-containing protein [Chloroflexi bacterium]|nr:ATP-binding cassette domain-containing protein [Chloroflexota bacterium]